MQSRLFEIDPMAGIGYGMYNALKKEKGSFEDFLLHYDSHQVNEGDNSWLTKLISEDIFSSIASPEIFEAMGALGINGIDFLSSGNFFDTQTSAYKLQILQEMQKRKITPPPNITCM
ncbi:MAG: hypothetical protein PHN38_02685 [Sulfurospirillaceae bacterium]|nr:hypothetical protein [Sulfurospirillaceae bacterium]